jgi:hypothetical protein
MPIIPVKGLCDQFTGYQSRLVDWLLGFPEPFSEEKLRCRKEKPTRSLPLRGINARRLALAMLS